MNSSNSDKVLIVDDAPLNLLLLTELLSNDYQVIAANSGERALELCADVKPNIVLLDVMMPNMDGFEVCAELKNNPLTQDIPIIFVTAKTETIDEERGFFLGAVDYIQKPFSPSVVRARVKTQLNLHNQRRHLQELVDEKTQQLRETQQKVVDRLGRAAEYKDNETGMHVIRMSHYAYLIARQLGCSDTWCDLLRSAAPMHDVGKIGISDSILCKPGRLTADEREEMEKHCSIGADIIGNDSSPLLQTARQVALYHHERWDGQGYPHGLSGDDIPLAAQIVAVADVFDALTSVRPYKKAWDVKDACDLIKNGRGTQFSPLAVDAFFDAKTDILLVMEAHRET